VNEDRPESDSAVQEYGRSNPDSGRSASSSARSDTCSHIQMGPSTKYTSLRRRPGFVQRAGGRTRLALDCQLSCLQMCKLMRWAAMKGQSNSASARSRSSPSAAPYERRCAYEYTSGLEPSHPKMGILVKDAANTPASIVARKRDVIVRTIPRLYGQSAPTGRTYLDVAFRCPMCIFIGG